MIKKIFQGRLTKCKIVTEFLPTSNHFNAESLILIGGLS